MMHERLGPSVDVQEAVDVDSFRSASLNKDPLLYPGDRPSTSYVTDGKNVLPIQATCDNEDLQITVVDSNSGTKINIDDYLIAHGVPEMNDRIPVISFGSNMCPASLKSKFAKTQRSDMQVVPTLYTYLPGHDVVWSGGPGINGNFIAILYSGQETKQTKVQIGVSFLTREQLLVMHATELNYDLSRVPVEVDGVQLSAYCYKGKDSVYTDQATPVAVKAVPARGRTLSEASTLEMLDRILTISDIKSVFGATDVKTAREYINFVSDLKKSDEQPDPKLALKKRIHKILEVQGYSRTHDTDTSNAVSWANPSVLQTYGEFRSGNEPDGIYVLPSTELAPGTWTDESARRRVLYSLNTHFHRHYPASKTVPKI